MSVLLHLSPSPLLSAIDCYSSMDPIKTIVFVVGFTPYKENLMLPRQAWWSIAEINDAALQQDRKQLPTGLLNGHFKVVSHRLECQVAIFVYKEVIGCSTTTSMLHKKLHVPVCAPSPRYRKLESLLILPLSSSPPLGWISPTPSHPPPFKVINSTMCVAVIRMRTNNSARYRRTAV